jgi:hypothetical protein
LEWVQAHDRLFFEELLAGPAHRIPRRAGVYRRPVNFPSEEPGTAVLEAGPVGLAAGQQFTLRRREFDLASARVSAAQNPL